jgi:hypothetical protein
VHDEQITDVYPHLIVTRPPYQLRNGFAKLWIAKWHVRRRLLLNPPPLPAGCYHLGATTSRPTIRWSKGEIEEGRRFDVLAHVAYALAPLTREERAAMAKVVIGTSFNAKQQGFLDFVLSHYVSVGVDELDPAKLTPLLRLKYYNSIADAVADLGKPEEINGAFVGFQKFLYQKAA